MTHSYVCVRVHCVWSTYRRHPWISAEWRDRLFACLSTIARRKGALLLGVGGVEDHVHLYVALPRNLAIAHLVAALKANSSRWIHETFPRLRSFAWQRGYAAFSVSQYSEEKLIKYIQNQERHHRDRTFAGELTNLVRGHGLMPSLEGGTLEGVAPSVRMGRRGLEHDQSSPHGVDVRLALTADD